MLLYTKNNKKYKTRKDAKRDIGLWAYKCAERKGQIIYLNDKDDE